MQSRNDMSEDEPSAKRPRQVSSVVHDDSDPVGWSDDGAGVRFEHIDQEEVAVIRRPLPLLGPLTRRIFSMKKFGSERATKKGEFCFKTGQP